MGRQSSPTGLLSIRGYARHRGVSHKAVQKALARGRIATTLGKIDPVIADRAWAENSDWTKAGAQWKRKGVPVDDPIQRMLLHAMTAHAYREKLSELVNADDVRQAWARITVVIRTGLLAIPEKVSALMPHLSNDDVKLLDDLVREALGEAAAENTELE
jgi:hypothetical protein